MKGALLINLGSPESPDPKDVKPYLDEFLMDRFVIDVPFLLRAFLVRGLILRKRPERSAAAYKKIWWDEGSPLIVLSKRMFEKVKKQTDMPVSLAMRYGKPSILQGLQELHDQGVDEVLLFPLYPQHAMASTVTILVLAEELRQKHFPNMKFSDVPAFYNKPDYIQNLADSMKRHLDTFEYDHLLFSYHGIPERHIRKTDITKSHCKIDGHCCQTKSEAHQFCYRHQCFETTRQVVELLGIPEGKYSQTFQSRLAGDKWLEPYTDVEINKMPAKGIKNLAVVTPAFVADCLETLEEIAMEANHQFKEHGGENFLAIPCLNDDDAWSATVAKWINDWANN
ncbi:ferrochelatase [Flavobacterium sp.]|uniref:ferrochelatase n=1 Tax=Flavobacterium sp. TaxID=239 RepID=UPI0039E439CB